MKKYICFALALITVFSLVACSGGNGATNTDEAVDTVPVTDDSGSVVGYETTIVGSDDSTTDVAVTTDSKGGSKTTSAEEAEASMISELQGMLTGKDEDGLSMDTTATTMPRKNRKTTVLATNSSGYPAHSKTYEEILKGDTYTLEVNMTMTMDGTSMAMPVKYVKDGDNFAMVTTINVSEFLKNSGAGEDFDLGALGSLFGKFSSGITVKYIAKDGKYYTVIPILAQYMEIDESDMAGMGFEGLDFVNDLGDAKYKGASVVTSNGKEYTCEEYEVTDPESGETATVLRYYQGGTLKRIETERDDTTFIVEIKNINADVDYSAFRIPPTYKKGSMNDFS